MKIFFAPAFLLFFLIFSTLSGSPTLEVPNTIEGDGPVYFGTVTLAAPASPAQTVFLHNSHPDRITIPQSITVPDGEISAVFSITPNPMSLGEETIEITATIPGTFAEEGFNYTPDSNIRGQDGGFGFIEPWASTSGDNPVGLVVEANLSYASGGFTITDGPNALRLVNGIRAQRAFSDITDGQFWVSALVGKKTSGWNTDFGLIDTNNQTRFTLRYNGSAGEWDISQRDDGQTSTGVTATFPSVTHAVFHFDMDERKARVFLNATPDPSAPPVAPDVTLDLVEGFSGFRAIQWFGFNDGDLLDAIAMSRTWEGLWSETTTTAYTNFIGGDPNDIPTLTFHVPGRIVENDDPHTVELQRTGDLSESMTVYLSSSHPTRLHLPNTVTFAEGENTVGFELTPIDNVAFDGDVSVSLRALHPASIATEDFLYGENSNLDGLDGGIGFDGPWYNNTGHNPAGVIVSSDFTFTRQGITIHSSPTSLRMVDGSRVLRNFPTVESGDIWVSALLRKVGYGGQTTFGLLDQDGQTRLSLRYNGSSSQWEFWQRDGETINVHPSGVPPYTLHIVLRVNLEDETTAVYLNSDLVGNEPTNPMASISQNLVAQVNGISGLYWFGYGNDDLLGSIRVASRFQDLRAEVETKTILSLIDDDIHSDYNLWTLREFGTLEPGDLEGSSASDSHPDSGLANLLHYAVSAHATAPAVGNILQMMQDPDSGQRQIHFPWGRPDIEYQIEASTDLINWTTENVELTFNPNGHAFAVCLANTPQRFFRLAVTAIPMQGNPGTLDKLTELSAPLDLNDTQIQLINERANATSTPWVSSLPSDVYDTHLLTDADVVGPDGLIYPDWTRAGVPGGIPEVPVVVEAADYGAIPNNDEPDTEALHDAIEAAYQAGGGAVLLEAGTYTLDEPLLIRRPGVVLRGAGVDDTTINFTYAGPVGKQVGFANAEDGDTIGPFGQLILHARTQTDTASPIRLTSMQIRGPGDEILASHEEGDPEWYRYPPPLDRPSNFTLTMTGSQLIQELGTGTHQITARTQYVLESFTHTHTITLHVSNNQAENTVRQWYPAAITFQGAGASGQPTRHVADTIPRGGVDLTLNNADPIQPGDYVVLNTENDSEFLARHFATNSMLRRAVHRVAARDDNNLTLADPVRIDWPSAASVTMHRLQPLVGNGVENLTLHQTGDLWTSGIVFRSAAESWIRDVKVVEAGRNPIDTWDVKHLEMRDLAIDGARYTTGGGGTAYFALQAAYDCLVENVYTTGLRHAPNVQWSSEGNVIRNSIFMDSGGQWHAGYTRENLFENLVINSTGNNGSYRFALFASVANGMHGAQGPRNVVYACDVTSYNGGIKIGGMTEGWIFAHNRIEAHSGPALVLLPGTFGFTFVGNHFATAHPNPSPVWISTADCLDNFYVNNHFSGTQGVPVFSCGAAPGQVVGLTQEETFSNAPTPTPDIPSIFEWQRNQ